MWRLRTAQAITAAAAVLAIVGWGLTTGTSYSLVSHFVHMRPTTTVATARPEVGVLVDAPAEQLPALASAFAGYGLHVSFAFDRPPTTAELTVRQYGDQPVPQLPHGGLVRWLGDARPAQRHPTRRWASTTTSSTRRAGPASGSGGWPTVPAAA